MPHIATAAWARRRQAIGPDGYADEGLGVIMLQRVAGEGMIDFAAARRAMVQGQIRINDVTEPRLTTALLEVPRERFVPPALAPLAYLDRDLPLGGHGTAQRRHLLKPITLAKLIQAAEIRPTDRILDVGCGTGYAAALLVRLGGAVVALEEESALADEARRNLHEFGEGRANVVHGPLAAGWPAAAPYDVILLEGRTEVIPTALLDQLVEADGRLVCVQGTAQAARGYVYRRAPGDVSDWPLFDAPGTPLLPGFARPPTFEF